MARGVFGGAPRGGGLRRDDGESRMVLPSCVVGSRSEAGLSLPGSGLDVSDEGALRAAPFFLWGPQWERAVFVPRVKTPFSLLEDPFFPRF